jgi:hypothetical protein
MVQYDRVQGVPSKDMLVYAMTDTKEHVFCAIAQAAYPPSKFTALLPELQREFYRQYPNAETQVLSREQVDGRFLEGLAEQYARGEMSTPQLALAQQKAREVQGQLMGTLKVTMQNTAAFQVP